MEGCYFVVTNNVYIECDVCSSIIRVRTQFGWVENNPVKINCGNCDILIDVNCVLNPFKGEFRYEFKNASLTAKRPENYIVETSGEFLVKKIASVDKSEYTFPPYMRVIQKTSIHEMEVFKSKLINFLHEIIPNWHKHRRIFELWNLEDKSYIKQEIHKFFPARLFPSNNLLEIERAIQTLFTTKFSIFLGKKSPVFYSEIINNEFQKMNSNDTKKIIDYCTKPENILASFQKKIFNILDKSIEIFPYILPAYGSYNFFKEHETDFNLGISTCTFDNIKQFYLDVFESMAEMSILLIALNNLKYRKNINDIDIQFINIGNIKNLNDLKKSSKGVIVKSVNPKEFYSEIFDWKMNNKLRNAIAHNNYVYNGTDQKIIYTPDDKKPDKKEDIYLVDFAIECVKLLQYAVIMGELIHNLRKIEFIFAGHPPCTSPDEFNKTMGRNEKCYCGSGIKYKNCHGKKHIRNSQYVFRE